MTFLVWAGLRSKTFDFPGTMQIGVAAGKAASVLGKPDADYSFKHHYLPLVYPDESEIRMLPVSEVDVCEVTR